MLHVRPTLGRGEIIPSTLTVEDFCAFVVTNGEGTITFDILFFCGGGLLLLRCCIEAKLDRGLGLNL